MSLAFNMPAGAACTHALVIGAGDYPNHGWGVGPIDPAAHSALAFATWLRTAFPGNPQWPLSTIDLLVSMPGAPVTFDGAPVEAATTANVFAAITRWFARCHQREDNLAVFYFAGHGVEKGMVASLLTQDFGGNALDAGDDALNLNVFTVGMERCLARRQWFVIDACRNTPPPLVTSLAQFGRAGVAPDANDQPSPLARDHVVLRAAAASQAAYGKQGEPSRFTRALIKALDGAAWDDDTQPWTTWSVRSERLVTVVNHLLELEERLQQVPSQRARAGGDNGGFVLWQPQHAPKVPVYVTCAPPDRMEEAALTVRRNGAHYGQRQAGYQDAWEVALEATEVPYVISADFPPPAQPVQAQVVVRPPSRKAEVNAP